MSSKASAIFESHLTECVVNGHIVSNPVLMVHRDASIDVSFSHLTWQLHFRTTLHEIEKFRMVGAKCAVQIFIAAMVMPTASQQQQFQDSQDSQAAPLTSSQLQMQCEHAAVANKKLDAWLKILPPQPLSSDTAAKVTGYPIKAEPTRPGAMFIHMVLPPQRFAQFKNETAPMLSQRGAAEERHHSLDGGRMRSTSANSAGLSASMQREISVVPRMLMCQREALAISGDDAGTDADAGTAEDDAGPISSAIPDELQLQNDHGDDDDDDDDDDDGAECGHDGAGHGDGDPSRGRSESSKRVNAMDVLTDPCTSSLMRCDALGADGLSPALIPAHHLQPHDQQQQQQPSQEFQLREAAKEKNARLQKKHFEELQQQKQQQQRIQQQTTTTATTAKKAGKQRVLLRAVDDDAAVNAPLSERDAEKLLLAAAAAAAAANAAAADDDDDEPQPQQPVASARAVAVDGDDAELNFDDDELDLGACLRHVIQRTSKSQNRSQSQLLEQQSQQQQEEPLPSNNKNSKNSAASKNKRAKKDTTTTAVSKKKKPQEAVSAPPPPSPPPPAPLASALMRSSSASSALASTDDAAADFALMLAGTSAGGRGRRGGRGGGRGGRGGGSRGAGAGRGGRQPKQQKQQAPPSPSPLPTPPEHSSFNNNASEDDAMLAAFDVSAKVNSNRYCPQETSVDQQQQTLLQNHNSDNSSMIAAGAMTTTDAAAAAVTTISSPTSSAAMLTKPKSTSAAASTASADRSLFNFSETLLETPPFLTCTIDENGGSRRRAGTSLSMTAHHQYDQQQQQQQQNNNNAATVSRSFAASTAASTAAAAATTTTHGGGIASEAMQNDLRRLLTRGVAGGEIGDFMHLAVHFAEQRATEQKDEENRRNVQASVGSVGKVLLAFAQQAASQQTLAQDDATQRRDRMRDLMDGAAEDVRRAIARALEQLRAELLQILEGVARRAEREVVGEAFAQHMAMLQSLSEQLEAGYSALQSKYKI